VRAPGLRLPKDVPQVDGYARAVDADRQLVGGEDVET
jgi:hypothetical protein